MRTLIQVVFSACLLSALACVVPPAVSADDDAMLADKLVAGSPWVGRVWNLRINTAIELTFTKVKGELHGEMHYPATVYPNSSMRFLSVKKGVVSFENQQATTYELHLDDAGKLAGRTQRQRYDPATVLLSPSTASATISAPSAAPRLAEQPAMAEQLAPPKVEASRAVGQSVAARSPEKPVEQPLAAEQPVPPGSAEKPAPPKPAEPAITQKPALPRDQPDRAPGITDMKKGEGGSAVRGSAGPSGAQGAASDLERCEKPIGTLAVVEPQHAVGLSRHGLGSPIGLIRLMVQQSNCFLVLERGAGMQNVMQERALAESGQLRQGSNMGGGQLITADYVMTPSVSFVENDAGGIGGALGGFIPGGGGALFSGLAGGLKFKEAQTGLLLADTRTGVQVASAEGSAKKADLSLGGLVVAGGAGAALGGYANTNEGKVIAASFVDNYNHIVRTVRGDPTLQREVRPLAEEAAARPKAGVVFSEGDVLRPKISSVKLLGKPSEAAETLSVLSKSEEMIFLGKEQDGFVNVETAKGSGWVKKILVTR